MMTEKYVDINCDLGESNDTVMQLNDEAVMPFITSANIACGFHAGNPLTIGKTIELALKYEVSIGAHPGYYDPEGFGRRAIAMSNEDLRASVLYQVGALKSMAEAAGAKLKHVKPHGALYNSASVDFSMAMVIAQAIKDIDSSLILVGLSGSELISAAKNTGIAYASEVFADRAYNDDGTLVSREHDGSVLNNMEEVIERVIKMVTEQRVNSISGKEIAIVADTICLHGDNPMAPIFAEYLRSALISKGIVLKPLGEK